ncbi:MAG: glycosyltransferase family 4 protein [Candidatus Marinimicrobia bacterium]|nr:glycosyltransferase family 4 protein [Candidatus Neomarinimicrobiota bacterium]
MSTLMHKIANESIEICHIQMAYYPGSEMRAFYEYTQALSRMGHHVCVIAAGKPDEATFECVNGVEVYRIKVRSISKKSLEPVIFLRKAIQILRAEAKSRPFDVIHTYTSWEMIPMPLLMSSAAKRFVFDIRSNAISGGLFTTIGKVLRRISRLVYDAVIVLDDALGKDIFGNCTRYHIVPLGVDLNTFSPVGMRDKRLAKERFGLNPEKNTIGFISSLYPTRRCDRVLETYKVVMSKKPDTQALIVGDGPDFSKLQHVINHDSILKNRVKMTGKVPITEVHHAYHACDVFLSYIPINSIYDPQPPLKTIEALASGVPVIATATRGNKTFIQDQVNGLLANDNVEDLASKCLTILSNKCLRQALIKAGIETAKKFEWNKIVRDYLLPIYLDLLSSK